MGKQLKTAEKEQKAEAAARPHGAPKTKAEEGTLNALLEQAEAGSEESEDDEDWLTGKGLKFAVDSNSAYKIDEARARKTIQVDKDKGLDDMDKERMRLRRNRERYHLG